MNDNPIAREERAESEGRTHLRPGGEVRYTVGQIIPVDLETAPPAYISTFQTVDGTRNLVRGAANIWQWVDAKTGQPLTTPDFWYNLDGINDGDVGRLRVWVTSNVPQSIAMQSTVVRPEPLAFTPFSRPVLRPAEPEPGMVIGFEKQFTEDGTRYQFAAISVDANRWYLSGPRYGGQVVTWHAMLDFIGGPEEWFRVGVVGSWVPLGDL